jgi:hypothetical protein
MHLDLLYLSVCRYLWVELEVKSEYKRLFRDQCLTWLPIYLEGGVYSRSSNTLASRVQSVLDLMVLLTMVDMALRGA